MTETRHGSQPDADSSAAVGHRNVFFDFVPWILFDVVAGPSTWMLAALVALAASVVLIVPDLRRHGPKLLDVVGIVFFGVLCVLGLVLDRHDLIWLETYAQVISNGVIAVAALGSLAFVPFTEQYAREQTPPEIWNTPAFKRTNRLLTTLWGTVFLVTAILGLVALHVSGGTDWYNWIIPIGLLLIAVKVTAWYPEYVRRKVRARLAAEGRAPL
ncbi:hypothetical protein ACWCP6_15225 [Streptomyces sp. NPDC002004]